MGQKKKVIVIGARGYSGLELCRILLKHPLVELTSVLATEDNWKLSDYLPEAAAEKIPTYSIQSLDKVLDNLHTAFLATPVETSMELAPILLARNINVIDLSGAFRLDEKTFQNTYGIAHTALNFLNKATYGLVPFAKPSFDSPALISNPGCYATSVLMALIPLIKAELIHNDSIVIDAKSGTTGAGKKATETQLFAEVEGELLPYRIGKHQHLPEITKYIQEYTGQKTDPFFNTHLIAARRGIISSIYAKLKADITSQKIKNAYSSFYQNSKLIHVTELTSTNERQNVLLKKVVGSARTQISFKIVGEKLYVFSLIDNLLKGAASQAVENFNRLIDVPSETVLLEMEGVL